MSQFSAVKRQTSASAIHSALMHGILSTKETRPSFTQPHTAMTLARIRRSSLLQKAKPSNMVFFVTLLLSSLHHTQYVLYPGLDANGQESMLACPERACRNDSHGERLFESALSSAMLGSRCHGSMQQNNLLT